MRRLALATAAAAALAVVAIAAASSAYALRLTGATRVKPNGALTLKARGSAPKRSVLNIFIDHKKCAGGAQAESARYGASANARPGYPYFVSAEGARVVDYSVPVRGAFTRHPLLHAGTAAVKENLCGYLNVLDAPTPKSVAATSRSFTVTG